VRRLAALALVLLLALPARAQDLVVDLSQRVIEITTGFAGAELLVFGAVEGGGEVVVIVRGPTQNLVLRRKERVAGIWINGSEARFDAVPSFYALASTRPLWEILPEAERRLGGVGVAALPITARGGGTDPEAFRRAFMGLKDELELYIENEPPAQLVSGRLFSARINFPATVITGTYRIEALLVRAGRIVEARDLTLTVRRVGVGAEIWRLAHEWPLLYGFVAILVAGLAGWLGSMIFRRS
jgi:uncharacterized protein (TIGR02186 family)